MKFIPNESTDVYYNLALEEYVLNEFRDDDYVILWRDGPCIVVGKHQNIFEEIDCRKIEKKGVDAARRTSGGGAVFHDKGNLNYSFIMDRGQSTLEGYDQFINPVVNILRGLGAPVSKRNACDIAVGDKKVSGSAQAVKKDRILHHGTLLFDADLDLLHELLKPSEGSFESKAVKSVRSEVANIKDFIADRTMSIDDFKKAILRRLFPDGLEERRLTGAERKKISEIVKTKYSTWEWNYGASPKFTFRRKGFLNGKKISVELKVEKGVIRECGLDCEGLPAGLPAEEIRTMLLGQRYSYRVLSECLHGSKGFEELVDYLF